LKNKTKRAILLQGLASFVIGLAVFSIENPNAWAQQTVTSATLSGRIADPGGASISGAILTATNPETNQKQLATSDGEGRFRFPYLPVGAYKLSVDAQGFSQFTKELTLTVGQALYLPVKLEVAALSAKVTVTSDVPLIETVRTQVTETIRPAEIDQLPLNGRNYLDLALLVPGVSPTNTGSNQRFAETSAVPGQGISVAGQRNLYNSFIVDGLSANDDAADLTGTYYSEEVVNQFQVITSGGIAEFGRASGAIVNIITKSGTNDWRGNIYGFARNQRFDARNPLATTKDLLTQAQYGGTIGGPLKRDRTFFFTNFEQTRRNYSAVITIAPAAVTAINNRLNAVNYRGPRIETGIVPASFDTTNFFARLDHKLNDRNQLNAHYSLYHITADNSRTVGGLNAVSRGSGLNDTDQTVAVSNITTVSNRTLNEARFQFTHSRLGAPINDSTGPAAGISGVANFGTATSSPLARDIDLFELVDNVSTQRGAHSPKAGVDYLYNRVNILPGRDSGRLQFHFAEQLSEWQLQHVPASFRRAEPVSIQSQRGLLCSGRVASEIEFYDQCRIEIRPAIPSETDSDEREQLRAAAWVCLFARQTQNRDSRELRHLRRSHPTARDFERAATRWLEVRRRPAFAGASGRPGFSECARDATGDATDEAKHYAH